MHARFCLCPPRLKCLFPLVLWKSYNQILLGFKVRFPEDSQSLCCILRPGSLTWGSDLHNNGRTSLVLFFSSLWVTHLVGMEFDFIIIVPFLPSRCGFFFTFGHGVSFFGRFQYPPSEKAMAPHSSTLAWKIPWAEEPGRL